ncbi:MAG: hypothetical protein HQ581_09950 [Planctomycetes bacterium]|nr:hypothetical protein [Planctomycetota bacterium]
MNRLANWAGIALAAVALSAFGVSAMAQSSRHHTGGHVSELAAYFEDVQISEPVRYGGLAVYPVLLRDGDTLRGSWLTTDEAISRGKLRITEKGGGSVPVVEVTNTSHSEHIFLLSGEVLSGGKQTRTIRKDVILAPGQRIDLSVFCVEKNRWSGGKGFSSGGALLPQSIQKELRKGADQARVWSEVARNNRALGAENATGSLESALRSPSVAKKLADVRRTVLPRIPDGTVGYIFVSGGRAVGAEFLGSNDLARRLLPKLLGSYAVDLVVIGKHAHGHVPERDHSVAIDFFKRVRDSSSQRTSTPGSGAGIRTRGGGLLGDGVSLGSQLVHYGVQIQDRIIVVPMPRHDVYPR